MRVVFNPRSSRLPAARQRLRGGCIAAALLAVCAAGSNEALASSHREAPFITTQPKVDGTDFYMFNSYDPLRLGYVTLVADYQPLEDPFAGPNYYTMDPEALYEIHINNNGNAHEQITFQFRFQNKLNNIALDVGGKSVAIPLLQAGPVAAGNSSKINVEEGYTVHLVRGDRRHGIAEPVTDAQSGSPNFIKPLDYIGDKTFGSAAGYKAYAAQYLYTVKIPGCAYPGKVFVGQRKDPFVVALGQAFDLINLNPLGPVNGNVDALAKKNVTAIEMEVHSSCLTAGRDPVIGGWTTASLKRDRTLRDDTPGSNFGSGEGYGEWKQVSRLGMPLVNELVIGLPDKDRFNESHPQYDAQFANYVTNPTFPALIQVLFPSAPAPTKFPRVDLEVAFLTGIPGLNKPLAVTPSEMLRLNTSTHPVAKGSQKNLGVIAGDAAGFPNGRRPGDDVVDVTLRVAMGVLCTLNAPSVFGCVASDAPAGAAPLTDGAYVDDSFFDGTFPYLREPLAGAQ